MIKAILMDFNGVVIDDEPIQMKAYQEILAEHGTEPAFLSIGQRDGRGNAGNRSVLPGGSLLQQPANCRGDAAPTAAADRVFQQQHRGRGDLGGYQGAQ